jgi:hypothetical protein
MQYADEAAVKGTVARPHAAPRYGTRGADRCYAPPAGAALDA